MKRNRKRLWAWLLVMVMTLSAVGCSGSSGNSDTTTAAKDTTTAPAATEKTADKTADTADTDSDTIKIGVILSFTGSAAYESEMLRQGYDFAVKYWNDQGGIEALGGKKIELLYADHADDVETGVTELERLLDEGCVMISGDYSSGSVTLAMKPICERRKIPFVVSQQSALEVYAEGNEWVFNPTNDASTNAQGLVGVIQMIAEMYGDEVHGVGFIAENSEWGQSQMASFTKYFEEAGIQIAYQEFYELGTTDFTTQVTKMKAAGVNYLIPVVSGLEEGVSLYRTVKEYELEVGFFCCGGVIVTDEFKEAVGEDANGIFSTSGGGNTGNNGGTGGGNDLTFENDPKTRLVIEKYVTGTTDPLKGVTFLVTESNGQVVGSSNGEYITDENGRIVIEGLEPGVTITAKEIKTLEGYVLDTTPKSIKIKVGEAQTLRFYNQKQGCIVVKKLDKQTGEPLAGVEFQITYSDGSYLDDDYGHLSSKGLYMLRMGCPPSE